VQGEGGQEQLASGVGDLRVRPGGGQLARGVVVQPGGLRDMSGPSGLRVGDTLLEPAGVSLGFVPSPLRRDSLGHRAGNGSPILFQAVTGTIAQRELLSLPSGQVLVDPVPVAGRSPQREQAHHETGAAAVMSRTAGFRLCQQPLGLMQRLLDAGHRGTAFT